MPTPDQPDHAAIERRVKRRVHRQIIMGVLSLSTLLTLFLTIMTNQDTYYAEFSNLLGVAFFVSLITWIGYTFWYVYQIRIDAGIRHEIEAERAHQLRLVEAGLRTPYPPRKSHSQAAYTEEYVLGDDGEILFDDEDDLDYDSYPPLDKPKRRLSQ